MAVSVNSVSGGILSTGLQGIQSGLNRANQAAGDIARSGTTEENGDLAKSIVDLKSSELQVKASAAVIKTADDILGTLIDTSA